MGFIMNAPNSLKLKPEIANNFAAESKRM